MDALDIDQLRAGGRIRARLERHVNVRIVELATRQSPGTDLLTAGFNMLRNLNELPIRSSVVPSETGFGQHRPESLERRDEINHQNAALKDLESASPATESVVASASQALDNNRTDPAFSQQQQTAILELQQDLDRRFLLVGLFLKHSKKLSL